VTRRTLHPSLATLLSTVVALGAGVSNSTLLAHPLPPPAHHDARTERCRCATAVLEDGWCGTCSVGYVAAIRVPSEALFDIVDAHGHEMDLSSLTCPGCRSAAASDGYCGTHKIGFVSGRGYVSLLTYFLALGDQVVGPDLRCEVCRGHLGSAGWCGRCGRGILGYKAYANRALFDRTQTARQRLLDAVAHLNTCEYCAVAMFADGRCPKCNITYRDGRPVSTQVQREAFP